MTLGECAQHFKHQISVCKRNILPRPKKPVLAPPELDTVVQAVYPATSMQEDILINEMLVLGSSYTYMITKLYLGLGTFSLSRLCVAWQQVCERRSALRTVFLREHIK
ncbi:hypothetical protein F5Y17DRAFT_200422 [Xylariaceae sp. FL0594]|nr:hypothetical protein F5Y17DRAFT_200422 [Xylariaceae sp. FL0594]